MFRLPRKGTALHKEDPDSGVTTGGASIVELSARTTGIKDESRLLDRATALGHKADLDSVVVAIAGPGLETGDNAEATDNDSVRKRLSKESPAWF